MKVTNHNKQNEFPMSDEVAIQMITDFVTTQQALQTEVAAGKPFTYYTLAGTAMEDLKRMLAA